MNDLVGEMEPEVDDNLAHPDVNDLFGFVGQG